MRRHWLGTLVGLCMLGLAAPTWAVPVTATQTGAVTEIRNGEFALDWVEGTPATLVAEWDTDDFVDLAEMGFSPGLFFFVTLADNPDASLTITVGSSTWVETDDIDVPSLPFLLFDSDGDLLGAQFRGANSDGHFFLHVCALFPAPRPATREIFCRVHCPVLPGPVTDWGPRRLRGARI